MKHYPYVYRGTVINNKPLTIDFAELVLTVKELTAPVVLPIGCPIRVAFPFPFDGKPNAKTNFELLFY